MKRSSFIRPGTRLVGPDQPGRRGTLLCEAVGDELGRTVSWDGGGGRAEGAGWQDVSSADHAWVDVRRSNEHLANLVEQALVTVLGHDRARLHRHAT
jgi:hypothetical protein